jgi:outer membrane immunogenic protein
MPVRRAAPAPAPVAPIFTWTGFYVGAHIGAGWGTKEWDFSAFELERGGRVLEPRGDVEVNQVDLVRRLSIPSFPFGEGTVNGFLAGVQAGFNWQTGPIVFGVGGEVKWTNIEGRNTCIGPGSLLTVVGVLSVACRSEVDFIAAVTGKIGFTWGQTMIYAKGGPAWAHEDHFITPALFSPSPASRFCDRTNCHFTGEDDGRFGWTFGAGVEHAFTQNWSAFVEYQYYDFDREHVKFGHLDLGRGGGMGLVRDLSIPIHADIDQHIHVFKFGLNYRFGFLVPPAAAPVTARF